MSIINSINFIGSLFYTNSSKKFIMNIWKMIQFEGFQTYVEMRFEYCFIKYLNEVNVWLCVCSSWNILSFSGKNIWINGEDEYTYKVTNIWAYALSKKILIRFHMKWVRNKSWCIFLKEWTRLHFSSYRNACLQFFQIIKILIISSSPSFNLFKWSVRY